MNLLVCYNWLKYNSRVKIDTFRHTSFLILQEIRISSRLASSLHIARNGAC